MLSKRVLFLSFIPEIIFYSFIEERRILRHYGDPGPKRFQRHTSCIHSIQENLKEEKIKS